MSAAITTLRVLSTPALSLQSQPCEAGNVSPPSHEGTGVWEASAFSRTLSQGGPQLQLGSGGT